MNIFGFFDYTPKSFVGKSARDILDMKQNKVKENFEKKYETDEIYMNELTDDQKKAIYLLRVLKKALSDTDKDKVLNLCSIENEKSIFKTNSGSVREPSITRDTSRRASMSPGNKSASQPQKEEPKETSTEVDAEATQQKGGGKNKKRKTNRTRKGKKKTQKRKY